MRLAEAALGFEDEPGGRRERPIRLDADERAGCEPGRVGDLEQRRLGQAGGIRGVHQDEVAGLCGRGRMLDPLGANGGAVGRPETLDVPLQDGVCAAVILDEGAMLGAA